MHVLLSWVVASQDIPPVPLFFLSYRMFIVLMLRFFDCHLSVPDGTGRKRVSGVQDLPPPDMSRYLASVLHPTGNIRLHMQVRTIPA